MWLSLLLVVLVLFFMTNVASQQVATEVDSSGGMLMHRQRLEILSPIDRQEFQKTREVPIQGKLSSGGGSATEKVCFKLVNDAGCFGFSSDQATASAARKELAIKATYHGCSALPVNGKLVLAAGCWILQFDLFDEQNVILDGILDTQYRSIHVVTIDDMVEEYYPNIPRLHGGSNGMIKHAFQNRGMGMILEFGIGLSTALLSGEYDPNEVQQTDQMIHSFDSLLGLPESWREGFGKGMFSSHGDIPSHIKGLRNVELHTGWVEETLPPFLLANPQARIGFVFLDMCVESSTAFVLEAIACRLGRGTVVLFGSYFNYILGGRKPQASAPPGWLQWTVGELNLKMLGFTLHFIWSESRRCPASALTAAAAAVGSFEMIKLTQ